MSLSKTFEILSDPHLRWRHFNYGQLSIELTFCIKWLIIWILDTLKLNLCSGLRMSSFPILEIILICAQTYNCYLFLLITWINWRWGASYAFGGHSLDKLCILPCLPHPAGRGVEFCTSVNFWGFKMEFQASTSTEHFFVERRWDGGRREGGQRRKMLVSLLSVFLGLVWICILVF